MNVKTKKANLIYFFIILLLTLVRIVIYLTNINVSDAVFSSIVQIGIMGLFPLLFYTLYAEKDKSFALKLKDTFDDWGYNAKFPPIVWLLTIICLPLLFFSNMGVSVIANGIIAAFGFTHITPTPTIYPDVWSFVSALFFTAVLPGTFEELTHRGLLLNSYKFYSDKFAIIMSALMFSLMHQNIVQSFYAFYAGLALGAIAIKTRSIFPSMILHFGNNALSVIMDYSSQKGGALGVWYDSLFDNMTTGRLMILLFIFLLCGIVLFKIIDFIGKYVIFSDVKDIYTDKSLAYQFADQAEKNKKKEKYDIFSDYFFIAVILLALATTAITFVWGINR